MSAKSTAHEYYLARKRAEADAIWENPEDPRHGTVNGYSNKRCRCEECTEAWRQFNGTLRDQREGTLSSRDKRHGKASTYGNYRCRCAKCRKAWTSYQREYRQRYRRSA